MTAASWLEPRASCYRCFKPRVTCVCGTLPRVDNRTRVVVVQHPRERFHALGTVRLIANSLARVRVDVPFAGLSLEAPPLGERAVLLYPDAAAPELAAHERLTDIVLVDGTWHHARTLLRDVPWLARLPRRRLRPSAPSRYRLRREPARDFVSSVEAITLALRTVEPELAGLDELLAAFDAMIERQIELGATARSEPRERTRRAESVRLLPRALAERWERLVVTYAERVPTGTGRQIAQWVAWRARDGAIFEAFPSVSGVVSPELLARAGLTPSDLGRAVNWEQASAQFAALAGPDAEVTAWLHNTLAALGARSHLPHTACLKAVYGRTASARIGTLEQVVARHALDVPELAVAGRARTRLGAAVALCRHLAQRGPSD